MKKRYSGDQIIKAIKQYEAGVELDFIPSLKKCPKTPSVKASMGNLEMHA